jgi:hypothetical protein
VCGIVFEGLGSVVYDFGCKWVCCQCRMNVWADNVGQMSGVGGVRSLLDALLNVV